MLPSARRSEFAKRPRRTSSASNSLREGNYINAKSCRYFAFCRNCRSGVGRRKWPQQGIRRGIRLGVFEGAGVRVAYLRIAPLAPTATVDPSTLQDLLLADLGGGVEHIRIRAGPHGVDIVAFIDSDSVEVALDILRHLVHQKIATSGLLRSWRIV